MIILRQNLFSKEKRKKGEEDGITPEQVVGTAASAAGLGLLGKKARDKGVDMSHKVFDKAGRIAKEENKRLTDALLEDAKKRGTRILKSETGENSAYTEGGHAGRLMRKAWNKIKKSRPDDAKQVKDAFKQLEGKNLGNGINVDYIKHIGTDTVVLGNKGKLSDADVLAHELGHSLYDHKGRSKDIIGKAAHATMFPSKILTNKLNTKAGTVGMAAVGFRSGMKSAERKSKGEKDTFWNKTKSVAIPLAIAAPTLIGEAAASRQGYKMLKKHGASKEALKVKRKEKESKKED